ncbi:hypothetical protein ALC53_05406 [Atta colombica]|uniref:Uncharacterized protein n=1 Tax=Atta colombica TaxID=520822 RepID=A0A195BHL5_9HYME|nr:hypothetical protein ALC53_05406 [Atta colombica]
MEILSRVVARPDSPESRHSSGRSSQLILTEMRRQIRVRRANNAEYLNRNNKSNFDCVTSPKGNAPVFVTTSSQAVSTLSRISNKRNKGVMATEEREESLPQYVAPSFSPVLPGAASRYSRIPVSPPPSPRCIADESIPADILTHWRSMPRSRERRRPQPPTFPTLQPPSRSQTRALGRVGRRLPTNVECIANLLKGYIFVFKNSHFIVNNFYRCGQIFGINDDFICLIENIWEDMVFALDLEENIIARIHVKLDGAFNSLAAVPRLTMALLDDQWMLRHYTAAFVMAPMPLFQNEISLYRKRCRRMYFRIGAA